MRPTILAARARLARHLQALWERCPATWFEVLFLWACGLALGALAFQASLALPWPAALAGWGAAAGLGLLLARRAEPILWEEAEPGRPAPEPAPPALTRTPAPAPAPPRVRPLLDLVEVPGGTFRMGSPPADEAQVAAYARDWAQVSDRKSEELMDDARRWLAREQPPHRVRLSPFLMARVPLTRGQWRAVMPEAPPEWSKAGDDDALPATHIDWPAALTLCNALSQRERLTPCYRQDDQGEWHWDNTADGYRLPTEAQWEHACRAGTQTRWFWGDDPEGAETHAWYSANSEGRLKPVGGKAANPWGLHDLTGLVLEWCWDRYGTYPQETDPPPQDPAGPDTGDSRVVRGGSFLFPPELLRPAVRDVIRPGFRTEFLGLRCVRSRARQLDILSH